VPPVEAPVSKLESRAEPLMLRIYFRFLPHNGYGRTRCWLNPVAIDPGTDIGLMST